jgi:CHAD domain-containing protein
VAGANASPGAGTADGPPRPAPIDLGPEPGPIEAADSFDVAGRKAMWLHVQRMLTREPALHDPDEVDALRRYRVATRRLRAAIRVFREAYPANALRPIRERLAELATAVGTVRDLDVRIADLDRWTAEGDDIAAQGLAPLRETLVAERGAAASAMVRQLDSKRHRRLLVALAGFVRGPATIAPGDAGPRRRTIGDRAASSVWLAYERLRAFASTVPGADLETLHGMRIEAKRLRYTLEFLGPVLGPERELLVQRLVALQDHLGSLNDAAVTSSAIRSFLAERHAALQPAEREATEAYLAGRERELVLLRQGVLAAWRPVAGITFARRLGRAVVVPPGETLFSAPSPGPAA